MTHGAVPVRADCDMETEGGGWTLAMNVNPADEHSVAYNNNRFWERDSEYGSSKTVLSRDYKSPAAYSIKAKEIMIQSVGYPKKDDEASFLTAKVKGYRIWPTMSSYPTLDSLFRPSSQLRHNQGTKPCKTGAPTKTVVGTTSSYDDIIRRGCGNKCLRTDMGWGSSWEVNRMSTMCPTSHNDYGAAGFAWSMNCDHYCRSIDCDGWNAQKNYPSRNGRGQKSCQGVDRPACSRGESYGCHHSQFYEIWNPITNKRPDCWDEDNYCNTGTYNYHGRAIKGEAAWTSRMFIRE